MAGSLWVDFKQVKERVTIEMVLSRYRLLDKFDRKGDRLTGTCPIHKGTRKGQFSVTPSKNAFKCFSGDCGKSGNQIDLVAAIENVPFRHAALLMQGWFGIEPRPEATKDEAQEEKAAPDAGEKTPQITEGDTKPKEESEVKENKPLSFQLKLDPEHEYLKSRGLLKETISHFGLGLCNRGSMQGRIAIPIHNETSDLIAYAGRWAGKDEDIPKGEGKYKLPEGFHKSLVVYNLNRVLAEATRPKLVILVEGYFSVFWLWQNGYTFAVSIMGSQVSDRQRALLSLNFKGVMIFFDGDEPGQVASSKATVELSSHMWVKKIICPDNLQPDRLPKHELENLLR